MPDPNYHAVVARTRESPVTPGVTVDGLAPGSVAGESAAIEALRRAVQASAVPIEPGTVLSERYRLDAVAGEGGMGVVWRGRDARLERDVAVKVLASVATSDQLLRMQEEARAIAALAHPNVVPVYDVGEHAGRPYIVMEYVEGVQLRTWMQTSPAPHWRAVIDVLRQAGQGLVAAHAAGLVHRDFKPSNVLVGEDGRVRVVDFGLARAGTKETAQSEQETPGPHSASLTGQGALVGTPAYMAPEQHEGERASTRSDVFSFAVAAFEALYGARPFRGSDSDGLLASKRRGPAEAPAQSEVPDRILAAIGRGLESNPDLRWPSMQAFVDALAPPRANKFWWMPALAGVVVCGAVMWGAPREEMIVSKCSVAVDAFEASLLRHRDTLSLRFEDAGISWPLREAADARLTEYARTWSLDRARLCDGEWAGKASVPSSRVEYCLDHSMVSLFVRLEEGAASKDGARVFVHELRSLPRASDCTDAALAARQPLPESRADRLAVERLLAWVALRRDDAKLGPELEQVDEQLEQARVLAHHPTTAAIAVEGALWATKLGKYDVAERLCAEGHAFATQGGADRVAMQAAMECITATAFRGDLESARHWERRASAVAAGIGAQPWERIEARSDLAVALATAGENEDARTVSAAVFDEAIALPWHDRGSLHVFVQLGTVSNWLGDYEGAVQRLETGIEKAGVYFPGNADLVFPCELQLAAVYRSLERHEESEQLFRKVLARSGVPLHSRLDAHLNLANTLGDLPSQQEQARTELSAARQELEAAGYVESAEQGAVWAATGHLERKSGNAEEARTAYAEALRLYEKHLEPGHVMIRAVERGLAQLADPPGN